MEIKRVACKACGAKLEVRNTNNEAVKLIRCPSCKATLQVVFHPAAPNPKPSTGSETLYAQKDTPHHNPAADQSTVLSSQKAVVEQLPALCLPGAEYRLSLGQNIVGRQSKTNVATVPINTTDHTVSRGHAMVNVVKLADGRYKAVISNYQNKNPIIVNGVLLQKGEELVLTDKAIVELGLLKLVYVQKSSPQ